MNDKEIAIATLEQIEARIKEIESDFNLEQLAHKRGAPQGMSATLETSKLTKRRNVLTAKAKSKELRAKTVADIEATTKRQRESALMRKKFYPGGF